MTRILFIGQEPDTVDFSDPALPPGADAGKIRAGLDIAMKQMADRGWDAELCLVAPDDSATVEVSRRLAAGKYDCVVIGGGIRIPPKSLPLFEQLLNAIHIGAPDAAIAFNTSPQDTANAVARWVDGD